MSYSAVASDFPSRLKRWKKEGERRKYSLSQELSFFWRFSSLISRYFYQLVARAWYALESIFLMGFFIPLFYSVGWEVSKSLCSLFEATSIQLRLLLLLLHPRSAQIFLCDIIKKSAPWFIEKSASFCRDEASANFSPSQGWKHSESA